MKLNNIYIKNLKKYWNMIYVILHFLLSLKHKFHGILLCVIPSFVNEAAVMVDLENGQYEVFMFDNYFLTIHCRKWWWSEKQRMQKPSIRSPMSNSKPKQFSLNLIYILIFNQRNGKWINFSVMIWFRARICLLTCFFW